MPGRKSAQPISRGAERLAEEMVDPYRPFPQIEGRIEDPRLLLGRGRYIDDLPLTPKTLHAALVRSPHAHARIVSIEISAAVAVQGVVAVYTGSDLKKVLDAFPSIVRGAPDYRALATNKVRYVGEPVAVVLARDRYIAEDGAALVEVFYDALPAIVDVEKACADDAPLLHEQLKSNVAWSGRFCYGDPVSAFLAADQVVSVTLDFPKYNSTPLETYGVVGEFVPESEGYLIHANFQGPFSLMSVLARALRVPDSHVRMVVPEDVGGSFGIKAMIYPYIGLIAGCARLAGQPVRWIEDRAEHLLGSASGTDRKTRIEAAITKDGRIRAIRMRFLENVGAYLRAPEPSCVMRSLTTFSGPYRIDNGEIDASCVLTNKLPTGLNRGYGGQQYMFSLERLMDAIARETGLDRIEIRRRNFLKIEDFPHRTATGSYYDSGDYDGCLAEALRRVKEEGWEAERDGLRDVGRLVGIGVATAVHSAASNIGYVTLALPPTERSKPTYNTKSGSSDFAQIALDPSGRLRVQVGTAVSGQGHATTVAQIVAREFGVGVRDVDVVDRIDTDVIPWTITSGTYASRFSVVVGGAVQRAATRLASNLRKTAAHLLKTAEDQLEIADGIIRVRNGNQSLSLRQLAGVVQWNRGDLPMDADVQLHVSESYTAPNLGPPDAENKVNAAATYGFMADLAMVEVDPKTFIPRVLKYVAVHDVGVAINPQLVRGQIAGGIVHGMGGALYEHIDYDDDGQMLSASLMDYLCPTAVEAPRMSIGHSDTPSPFSVLGSKGCGENSAMLAPAAIASAIDDALAARGVVVDRLPITPPMLWRIAGAPR
jgi:2-furoyl-CoA dehydrogenase large subunit